MKDIITFIKINESLKSESELAQTIKQWIGDHEKWQKIPDEKFNDLREGICEYCKDLGEINLEFSNQDLNKILDKDLICDIAGYIIESIVYKAVQLYCENKYENKHKLTSRSGRGLKINKASIYWDFAIMGIDEKFEVKSYYIHSFQKGPISPTEKQKADTNLIYIGVPYDASETGFTIDSDNIVVTRQYKKIKKYKDIKK